MRIIPKPILRKAGEIGGISEPVQRCGQPGGKISREDDAIGFTGEEETGGKQVGQKCAKLGTFSDGGRWQLIQAGQPIFNFGGLPHGQQRLKAGFA